MTIAEFVRRFGAKKVGRNSWKLCCPAHPERDPSLFVSEGRDGRLLLNCRSRLVIRLKHYIRQFRNLLCDLD